MSVHPENPPEAFLYNDPSTTGISSVTVQPQMAKQTQFVVQRERSPPPVHYGALAVDVTCSKCRSEVMTKRKWVIGSHSVHVCLYMTLLCAVPCAFLPFVMDECKDVIHSCPECKEELGRYRRTF